MYGIRVLRSHRLFSIAAVMTTLFAVMIVTTLKISRTGLVPLDIELPSYYRPGVSLTNHAPCYDYYYHSTQPDTGGCIQSKAGSLEYNLQFKAPDRTIQRASKWTFEMPVTVGDLVARWGAPRGRLGSLVIWADRGAYVLEYPSFSPDSKVYFISYGDMPAIYDSWVGFVNDHTEIITIPTPGLFSSLVLHP